MSIFLDFDGTITAKDTVGELANFALQVRASEGADLKQEWDNVVRAYIADYSAHVDGYHTGPEGRSLPEHEVEFLREAKDVETRSLGRVNDSCLFRGISGDKFREAGRELVRKGVVKLRPGFEAFVKERIEQGWRVVVVSVNWSAAFIEGAIGEVEGVRVVANEVREGDGVVVGPLVLNRGGVREQRNMTNSQDKLDVVQAVLEDEGLEGRPAIYFGDSTTDLECLLAADTGFVMSDKEDSSLLQTLRRIGKEVPHVRDRNASSRLAWTSNYEDIPNERFILN
ncbi:HAD-like domain-containing protein [Hypoxylon trugodes]|uniref:HAD-like domain-containing protein n=1 Tax=Hypoxylon trugodes TaxID=326681 RepID=UPI00219F698C|nr:HAD-like domain-containing protein [Hypoxylon trugodes]KAI1386203.1 HAD-like domain-containing protein [Hypoxylon trugodes]